MTQNRYIPLHSTQSGAIPTASGMFVGELAVNTADGKLFTRHDNQIVILNDTTNFISSSQQIVSSIEGQVISPAAVTSSFYGQLEGNKITLNTTTTANTILSSSIKSGIFNATEVIDPPIPTTKFSGVSVDYTAQRLGAVRSGILLASWSGSTVTYTDISNTDVGDTEDISFNFIRAGDDILLRAYSQGLGSGTWTVQFLFKMFPNLM